MMPLVSILRNRALERICDVDVALGIECQPPGSLRVAFIAGPPSPCARLSPVPTPVPATRWIVPFDVILRMRLSPVIT